jgi:fructan beta-fructosidase
MPFNQAMSLPNELKLKTTPQGVRMTFTPVAELESLRSVTHSIGAVSLSEGGANPLAALNGELLEIRAEFEPGTANEIAFNLRGVLVIYNATRGEISVGDHRTSAPLLGGKQRLIIYVDRTGLDVYAGDGLTFVPIPINLDPENKSLSLSVKGGTAKFSRLDVYNLKSSWQKSVK